MTATLDDIHNDLRVRTTTGEVVNLATVIAMVAGLAPWSEPILVDYEVDSLSVAGDASVEGRVSADGIDFPSDVSSYRIQKIDIPASGYRHIQAVEGEDQRSYIGFHGTQDIYGGSDLTGGLSLGSLVPYRD